MVRRFTGEFASKEQFTGVSGYSRHKINGDDLRGAVSALGEVKDSVLVLPSLAKIAGHFGGEAASTIIAVGKRANLTSAQAILEMATGFPVTPVSGFIVELRREENTPLSIALSGPAPFLVDNLTDPNQAQMLADEIVDRCTPDEALRFAQRLLGSIATAVATDCV